MAYNQTNLTQKSRVISAKVRTTDLPVIDESVKQSTSVELQDYVNAVVINETGELLVFEGIDNSRSWSSWQMVGKHLKTDEDPILAVQQELLLRTGYSCKNWVYLGAFVIDETQKAGAGYYFCAKLPEKTLVPEEKFSHNLKLKWVAKQEMKQALLDGRIAVINHALAISLSMLMCNDND